MGFLLSKIFDFFGRSKNNFKIIILGIQNAGKTTILYRLALGQLVKTTPTIGSNVEEISYNNVKFQAWDVGGQESSRQVWDVYFINSDAIVYVIDCNDFDNAEDSKTQFYKLLSNEALKNAVILIFANKQDLPTAKKVEDVVLFYELDTVKDHVWHIQPCSGKTGDGLVEGMKWLSDQLVFKSSNNFPNNPYMPELAPSQTKTKAKAIERAEIKEASLTMDSNASVSVNTNIISEITKDYNNSTSINIDNISNINSTITKDDIINKE